MPKLIREENTGIEATTTGRINVTLITVGKGSSGLYTEEVLKQAAVDKVFPKGTQMHIDHLTMSEHAESPAGSIKTLAAVLSEDAKWDQSVNGLVAAAKTFSPWRQPLAEMAETIGVSIAAGADVSLGQVDGKPARIVEKLYPDPLNRVDFVTVPGRGGSFSVLEAMAAREDLTDNERINALADALRALYAEDKTWAWVLDSDDENVWFRVESEQESQTFQQAYTVTDDKVTLTGDPVEVKAVTTYQPVTKPAAEDSPSSSAGVTENRKEPMMGTVQIEEAELATLRENASRATALEADNGKLKDALHESKKESMKSRAEKVVAEAFNDLEAPATRQRLAESFTLTPEGELDAEALRKVAEESAAEIKALGGAGQVRGLGNTTQVTEAKEPTDEDILAKLKEGK